MSSIIKKKKKKKTRTRIKCVPDILNVRHEYKTDTISQIKYPYFIEEEYLHLLTTPLIGFIGINVTFGIW